MLTLQDIRDAHSRIHDSIYRTPCVPSQTLGDITGSRVLLKLENLQMTGAFKERGALNTLLQLAPEERSRGVVAASAGNHAQGVAYHAARMKSYAAIVMPENTPLTKVTSTKRFGAEVILHGINYDEAYARALELSDERGYVLIHPFDDERIIAGQGTIGLEILEDAKPDAVIVPIGGGGLISGIACAIKEQRPECKIIGVESANAPSMKAAVEAGYPVDVPVYASIADGIIVKQPGVHTLKAVQKYVDEIVTVQEEEIAAAVIMLLDIEKTVVEGAGAVGLAALMFRSVSLKGKRVVIVLSGGNIDLNLLSRIIERGLIKDGRMARLRVELLDIPGQLAIVSDCVSKLKANVVEVYHNRSFFDAPLGKTYLDLTLETRGRDHIEEVAAALRRMGYKVEAI